MKKLLLILLLFPLSLFALTKEDIYKTGPITWLGIDYRFAVIDDTTITKQDLINKYYPDWNDIVIREKDKFKFDKTFHRGNVIIDNSTANKVNADIGNTSQDITAYDFNGRTGVGCILVITSMSKQKKLASGYLLFVDMANKTILDKRSVEGKPGGFGFRNYWANAISNIFEYTHDNWQGWRKEVLKTN